jgi:hypothetical protein
MARAGTQEVRRLTKQWNMHVSLMAILLQMGAEVVRPAPSA